MEEDWIGRAVSIVCDQDLGIFQGIIKDISSNEITIVRAFRNGVPLRKQNAEIVLKSTDIIKISLISMDSSEISTVAPAVVNKPTPVKLPNFSNILGAKQHEERELQQQLQKQQQQQQQQSQEKLHTPTKLFEEQLRQQLKIPRHQQQQKQQFRMDTPSSSDIVTIANNLNDVALKNNGFRRTPNNLRAPSAQQIQQHVSGNMKTTTGENNIANNVAAFFGNMIPPKVEVKMGASFSSLTSGQNGYADNNESGYENHSVSSSSSRPTNDNMLNNQQTNGNGYGNIAGVIRKNGNGGGSNGSNGGSGKNKQQLRNKVRRENSIKQQQQQLQHQTFGTSVDDPLLHEDFDFEGNLALFDKRAIWNYIESTENNSDVVKHAVRAQMNEQQKYRHNENVLESEPLQLRQIKSMFEGTQDFVTDEGLIIPTIPIYVRAKIEMTAEKAGFVLQRQLDILARGTSDLAISLLGGARRLTPNNCHQWPKIAIMCDDVKHLRSTNVGAATGRQLASHGLQVLLYLEDVGPVLESNIEIALFKATGNTIVQTIDALPNPDLVILSISKAILPEHIKKWLNENRASILAIDPPPIGINDIAIKYSILPILPLNGISSNNCGKLYLCNLGIPDKFYRDCGIKYKSPYGHKYVIPIHSKD